MRSPSNAAIPAKQNAIEAQPDLPLPHKFGEKKTEVRPMSLLIAIGVGTMTALYAVIIARCLKQPEW
jgi:hypothetical protein